LGLVKTLRKYFSLQRTHDNKAGAVFFIAFALRGEEMSNLVEKGFGSGSLAGIERVDQNAESALPPDNLRREASRMYPLPNASRVGFVQPVPETAGDICHE
jgi:hypothetical protein